MSNAILTVSQLNQQIRQLLEGQFQTLWLTAEISNFSRPGSGHWYFTLKDGHSQIRAAMFKGANRFSQVQPKDGMQVLVRGRISVYEPRGDYQFLVDYLEPAGDGVLKQQFEQVKIQLAQAGLFDSAHKQPLPHTIRTVGVVTSATGAAIHDILSVLKQRAPQIAVVIYPSAVQGTGAANQLAQAIALANARQEVDVLIVGRGGGSLEDLWCFNEPVLAYAIFHSQLPVISAVGHEVDVTISDYVADMRAATPSQAAEWVSSDKHVILDKLQTLTAQLHRQIKHQLSLATQRSQHLQRQLQLHHPERRILAQYQRLDELAERLQRWPTQLQRLTDQHRRLQQRLQAQHPAKHIEQLHQQQQLLVKRLQLAMQQHLKHKSWQFSHQVEQLQQLSPLAVLARGYSMTQTESGQVLQSSQAVKVGDTIISRFADGEVHSLVTAVTSHQSPH